jgi:hypothetical protein
MVGAEVTELIQGFVIAMGLETTEEDLMHTVFPHPTLSEMMHESVLDAYGRVIHMYRAGAQERCASTEALEGFFMDMAQVMRPWRWRRYFRHAVYWRGCRLDC